MKIYALCPICGYKLLKAIEIIEGEIRCPRCSHFLNVSISNGETTTGILEKNNKAKKTRNIDGDV